MAYRRTPAVDERLNAARDHLVDRALEVVADSGWAGASAERLVAGLVAMSLRCAGAAAPAAPSTTPQPVTAGGPDDPDR